MSSSSLRFSFHPSSPCIMGILNVTPDSFSESGHNYSPDRAVKNALEMVRQGADIIDVGGESTRPGAVPVSCEQEISRIEPVLKQLQIEKIPVSVDTRHAQTMKIALSYGAVMINDITALRGDSESLNIVAGHDCYICLMHMKGQPQTMQKNPEYDDVADDVKTFLEKRIETCMKAGISKERLIIDPGIGFGKTLEHNLTLFQNLEQFRDLGVTVLLGASRKSFIEKICGPTPVAQRLAGSLAACIKGYESGVRIFRVHDVAQTRQALNVWELINKPS